MDLRDHEEMKQEIPSTWFRACETRITPKCDPMDDDVAGYIRSVDGDNESIHSSLFFQSRGQGSLLKCAINWTCPDPCQPQLQRPACHVHTHSLASIVESASP